MKCYKIVMYNTLQEALFFRKLIDTNRVPPRTNNNSYNSFYLLKKETKKNFHPCFNWKWKPYNIYFSEPNCYTVSKLIILKSCNIIHVYTINISLI